MVDVITAEDTPTDRSNPVNVAGTMNIPCSTSFSANAASEDGMNHNACTVLITVLHFLSVCVPLIWLTSFHVSNRDPYLTVYTSNAYFDLSPDPGTVYDGTSDGIEKAIHIALAPYNESLWVHQSPEAAAVNQTIFSATGCDIFTLPFYQAHDERCIAYLTNTDHCKSFVPVQQHEDQRTAKFLVHFHVHPQLLGIVKVRQRSFPTEAHGEYISFKIDRHLGIRRTPPTGSLCLPKAYFRNVADAHPDLQMVKKYNISDYRFWIERDILSFYKADCVDSSIQLFMSDVVGIEESIYDPGSVAHDDSRYQMFNPSNGTYPSHADPLRHASIRVGFYHLASLLTLDFIMGNTDRSIYKNNNVVGGCTRYYTRSKYSLHCRNAGTLQHVGYPTFIHLDQGMYFQSRVMKSPLNNATDTFCLIPPAFHRRLQELDQEGTYSIIRFVEDLLTPSAFEFYRYESLLTTNLRLRQVLLLVERCAKKYGTQKVFEISYRQEKQLDPQE